MSPTVQTVLKVIHFSSCLTSQFAIRSLLACEPSSSPCPIVSAKDVVVSTVRMGDWFVVETLNFRVWSRLNSTDSIACARRCETLRGELLAKWLPERPGQDWTPKAVVMVHRTLEEFCAAVGTGRTGSSGCATVRHEQGRVAERRIDLRADVHSWSSSTLPHELAHLILADRFGGRRLPRWADEGIAVLAEPPEKQAERKKAASGQRAIALPRLLTAVEYPTTTEERDAFYAQSTALTDYLVSREGGTRFLTFVEMAMDRGHDVALKKIYRVNGIRELEREWNARGSNIAVAEERP